MNCTRTERAFFSLLRAGLWDRSPETDGVFPLSEAEWTELYGMTRRQTVTGICYTGLCRLPDAWLPPSPLLVRWVARVNAIEKTSQLMESVMMELLDAFCGEGLHPVVQKGHAVARFYPVPSLRESGDIDFWFPAGEMYEAWAVGAKLGAVVRRRPDGSRSFTYKGIEVELHRTLIDLRRPSMRRSLGRLIDEEGFVSVPVSSGSIPVPAALTELMLVDVHIMKHSFGVGVGLRQICDYVRAAEALGRDYDRCRFADLCRRFGISRWTAMLNEFAVMYLDASRSSLPDPGCAPLSPRPLMDIVKAGGNFGHYLPVRRKFMDKTLQRKVHTLTTFLRRGRFSLALAPGEAVWTSLKLLFGQIH